MTNEPTTSRDVEQDRIELSRFYRREIITFLKNRQDAGSGAVDFGALLADDLTLGQALKAIIN